MLVDQQGQVKLLGFGLAVNEDMLQDPPADAGTIDDILREISAGFLADR